MRITPAKWTEISTLIQKPVDVILKSGQTQHGILVEVEAQALKLRDEYRPLQRFFNLHHEHTLERQHILEVIHAPDRLTDQASGFQPFRP